MLTILAAIFAPYHITTCQYPGQNLVVCHTQELVTCYSRWHLSKDEYPQEARTVVFEHPWCGRPETPEAE